MVPLSSNELPFRSGSCGEGKDLPHEENIQISPEMVQGGGLLIVSKAYTINFRHVAKLLGLQVI